MYNHKKGRGSWGYWQNPLVSRNKWARRGRSLAYFLSSFLYVIASFILELVLTVLRAGWQAVLFCYQSWPVGNSKQEAIAATKKSATVPAQVGQTESCSADDDVVEALHNLGCAYKEARPAVAAARAKLSAGASEEELVKAALRVLAK